MEGVSSGHTLELDGCAYYVGKTRMKTTIKNSRLHRGLSLVASFAVIVGCLMRLGGCSASQVVKERKYLVAPTVLPGIRPEMNTPGFWIGRLSDPDKIILCEDEIRKLNQDIQTRLRLTKDIVGFPREFDGRDLHVALQRGLRAFRNRTLYAMDGRKAGESFYASIEDNISLDSIDAIIDVRFGLVVCNADQRLLPTSESLYAEAGDIDFDEVQNNALDIGTPVAILHESADRQWSYVMGPSSDGWVKTKNLGWCSQAQLEDIMNRPFVTIVRAKGNVYLDEELTQYYGFVRMGSKLFLAGDSAQDVVAVVLPARCHDGALEVKTGYLKRQETCPGSLAYTARNIIEQAFEMRHTPYGWGGANGQQDCSQFVQEVFATVGMALPRNSSDQAQVGQLIRRFPEGQSDEERREAVVTQAIPGVSLLHMEGHVMLYIGDVAGRPYAIHDVWAYREPGENGDAIRVVNRVAVTDLYLGQGSRIGSLLQRLKSVRAITWRPERSL